MAYKGQPTDTTLRREMTANKMFGSPMPMGKSEMGKAAKKMTPKMVAQRKRTRISNVASKVMGGLHSK